MSRFAAGTDVPVMRSQMELGEILRKYGATGFGYYEDGNRAIVAFRAYDRQVKFLLPLPHLDSAEVREYGAGTGKAIRKDAQAREHRERLMRQKWRCLLLSIKAKLETVESGIASFEEEFLAQICLPNGETVGSRTLPQIASAYQSGKMPPMLLEGPTN